MSLSDHQVGLLRTSWEEIAKLGMKEVGLAIFHQLFAEEVKFAGYFVRLAPEGTEFDLKDIKEYPRLVTHGAKVASSIGRVVKSLDNPSELEAFLHGLGRFHKLKKIPEKDFVAMGSVLIKVIKSVLQGNATDDVVQAWVVAYAVIKEGIASQL